MDRKLALTIQFAAMDRLSGSMRKIVGLGDSGAKVLAKMKREAKDLDQQLRAAQAGTAGATGNITALIARERELEAAIAGVNRQMDRQKRFMAIDNRVTRMQAQAEAIKSAGQQNMMAGAGLLAPFILAGRQAMNFSSGMVDIQQKAELTNRETAAMAKNIMAAARATHQMPENMRGSVDTLAGFGMDPRQAAQLALPIGKLGTAFKVDLTDAAAAAYANINNLKLPISQVATAFDIMAEGGKRGQFEIRDMARHFPSLTAQLQALGQKGAPAVADLTAALQVAMNTAGSADEAANNIANLLGKINSPTVINAFQKKFGVDLPKAMARARAEGKTTMEAFAEIATRATRGDISKLGWVVEDRQAQMGLLALIQNMDQYRKIRGDIAKASGTVDRAFNQREMQDASVAWSSFTGQLSATAILLGSTLLPAGTRFLGMLNNVLGVVGDWAQANPQLASGIMSVVAGLALARVGLGAAQFAFGSILGPMATMWGWWQKFRAIGSIAAMFPRAAAAFGVLRTAALFLGQGFMRAGMMMLANPLVLIITAIVVAIGLAAYLIYKNWDTIKAAFAMGLAWVQAAWANVQVRFNAGVAALRAIPGQMWTIGRNIMQGIVSGILSAPGAVLNALKSLVMRGVTGIRSLLGIKSPSRLFMGIGGHISDGLAIGVERGQRRPIQAVGRMAAGVAGAGAMALASPAAARAGPSPAAGLTINITVQQQPGEDGEALARRVADLIEARQRNAGRGAYRDD